VAGPIGIYVDRMSYAIVSGYLRPDSVEDLRSNLLQLPEVKSLLKSFGSQPDLSDEEQEEKWNSFVKENDLKESPNEWPQRMAMNKAHSRALGWMLNYVHAESSPDADVDHGEVKNIFEWAKSW